MSAEEQNHNQDTTTTNKGWGVFSAFKKTPQNTSGSTTKKDFSFLTKLLIFLIPLLLFATFYHYSIVRGSSFLGITLRTNVNLENGLVGHWTFDGSTSPLGESAILGTDDSGNGDLLVAQAVTATQAMAISTMSFYVNTAVGDLRLGIYDATGPGNGPGTLLASTAAFTPTTGWNTENLITPVTLPAGNYWLTYLPQSSSLHFPLTNGTGTFCYYSYTYGAMPGTFDTSPTCASGHWSLYAGSPGGLLDKSGNGNHGINNGAITTIGKIGQAMEFDGINDEVIIPTFDETFSAVTITAWVRSRQYGTAYNGIVFSRNYPDISGLQISDVWPGTTLAYVWDGSLPWDSGLDLPQNEWSFVALTVAPTLGTTYVGTSNGLSSASNAVAHGPATFNDLKIGLDWDAPSYWDGDIDEVRIYNRALTAREIEALYKLGEGSKLSVTPPTIPALENGLVGYWTLDGPDITDKVYDRSEQGNDGYFYGGATSSAKTAGKIGQGVRFDGMNDIIDIPASASLNNQHTFSYSVWVYPTSPTCGNAKGPLIMKGSGSTETKILALECFTGSGNGSIRGFVNTDTIDAETWASPGTFNYNIWQNIVMTYDNTGDRKVRLYVNGVEAAYDAQVAGTGVVLSDSAYNIGIGATGDTQFYAYIGKLDDVRMYDRALTATEIAKIYNLGEGAKFNVAQTTVSPLDNGLVSHLTFDGPDITTATATDVSGNGNDGEITGATTAIGKFGQSLEFDGVDDGVYIATIAGFTGATDVPFSWSFWLNSYGHSSSGSEEIIGWSPSRRCRYLNFHVNFSVACSVAGDEYNEFATISTTDIDDDQWHHVVYTHNSGVQNLYIDGVIEDTGSETFATSAYGIDIGHRPSGDYFDGSLDDVRIYNRAITADEVVQLYNLGR